ncbi:hypothetical protein [Novosphingobium aquimarinum]|uniref:hypothetical protein n=1 Tax=Novosphingobium aquimarinum TaxID=2682494 RepID=UPI0012EB2B64|nr:hypothetical protein [Novosphingobium aquimarinum]
MTTRTIVTAIGLGTALLLSACDGSKKADDGAADAGGRILDRSVTDDMLPYDTVRSRPPSAMMTDEPESGGASGNGARATGSAATDEADDATPADDSAGDEAAANDE